MSIGQGQGRTSAKIEGIQALLILGKKRDSLHCLGDVLLPHEYLSCFDCGCCQDGLEYSRIAVVGRIKPLIAFAISGSPLYYFWMWLAIASTVFWSLAACFAFSMSKVWLSSPSTLVMNSFLAGPAFLAGLLE